MSRPSGDSVTLIERLRQIGTRARGLLIDGDPPDAWFLLDDIAADAFEAAAALASLEQERDEAVKNAEQKYMGASQGWVDSVCHYRNLAISLGATQDQMLTKYDRELVANHDPNDKEGWDDADVPTAWEEAEVCEARSALLTGRLAEISQDLVGAIEDAMVLREEADSRDGLAAGLVNALTRIRALASTTGQPNEEIVSLRCRLGYHAPVRSRVVKLAPSPFLTSFTNAECVRCGKRLWENWRDELTPVGVTSNDYPVSTTRRLAEELREHERQWFKRYRSQDHAVATAEARAERLAEALRESEHHWAFIFNLAPGLPAEIETTLRIIAKQNLDRARAALVDEHDRFRGENEQ